MGVLSPQKMNADKEEKNPGELCYGHTVSHDEALL